VRELHGLARRVEHRLFRKDVLRSVLRQDLAPLLSVRAIEPDYYRQIYLRPL
jgi:hypothetical protein